MTERPRRIQRQRTRGWRMPPNTVYVGRPSKWGDPYEDSSDSRRGALEAYCWWLLVTPLGHRLLDEARRELRGKNLACWCPLDVECHADVLLAWANDD